MVYKAIIDHRLFAREVTLDVYPDAGELLDELKDPMLV